MGIKFSRVALSAGLDSCSFFISGHPEELEALCPLPQFRLFCKEHLSWKEIEVELTPFWFGEDCSGRKDFRDADRDHLLLMASFSTVFGSWREGLHDFPMVCAGSTLQGTQQNSEILEPDGPKMFGPF